MTSQSGNNYQYGFYYEKVSSDPSVRLDKNSQRSYEKSVWEQEERYTVNALFCRVCRGRVVKDSYRVTKYVRVIC